MFSEQTSCNKEKEVVEHFEPGCPSGGHAAVIQLLHASVVAVFSPLPFSCKE